MRRTSEINDYDYNGMMKDFELNVRHEDHLKKIRKRWQTESKKYRQTIERMKEQKEEEYKKKNNELMKKLKKKEQILITSLENQQKDKMRDKERAIAIMVEKEKLAKENVEKFLEEQEKRRQLLQIEINKKSKIYF